jgi:hypothetical protein
MEDGREAIPQEEGSGDAEGEGFTWRRGDGEGDGGWEDGWDGE